MRTLLLITIELSAVIHLMLSLIFFYFSKRTVRYLSQAWIMLLIGSMYVVGLIFLVFTSFLQFNVLDPILLIYLLVSSYLLSIYPLGMTMPGYLQWRRMWKYASPAITLLSALIIGEVSHFQITEINTLNELKQSFLAPDVILRIAMLILSGYYIINIFRLPHKLVKRFELPTDIIAYGTALGLEATFLVVLSLDYHPISLIIYILCFVSLNLFLSFRALRPLLLSIKIPDILPIDNLPTRTTNKVVKDDFNEMNKQRFEGIEYIMQHKRPFVDSDFNREKLCREVGLNRHIILETLRSQGYNDIHEYISRYRVSEMKRLIEEQKMKDPTDCILAGFKTPKTALSAYERYEGIDFHTAVKIAQK